MRARVQLFKDKLWFNAHLTVQSRMQRPTEIILAVNWSGTLSDEQDGTETLGCCFDVGRTGGDQDHALPVPMLSRRSMWTAQKRGAMVGRASIVAHDAPRSFFDRRRAAAHCQL